MPAAIVALNAGAQRHFATDAAFATSDTVLTAVAKHAATNYPTPLQT